MRKTFILSLVLAFACLANAGLWVPGLSYEVDSASGIVRLIADAPVITITIGALIPIGPGSLIPGTVAFPYGGPGDYPAALGLTTYPVGSIIGISGTTGAPTGITGTLVTFGYTGGVYWTTVKDETEMGLMNSEVCFQDGTTYSLVGCPYLIPEPASAMIMLLGTVWIAGKRNRRK